MWRAQQHLPERATDRLAPSLPEGPRVSSLVLLGHRGTNQHDPRIILA